MEAYEVRKDRAEVMGVAAIVLAALGKELGLEAYEVPNVGIREGVLLDLAESSVGKLTRSSEAPTIAAARAFALRVGHNIAHGEQVRMIAQRLFHALQPVHKLPTRCSTMLQLAALLHDVGEVVHRKSHHKHSEYLIMQGRIPGLSPSMRQMVAATARAHRKSLPSERKHELFAELDDKRRERVLKMATLLRLADTLDSNRRSEVVALEADIRNKKVIITVSARAPIHPHEISLQNRCKDFEEVFERKLVIETRIVSDAAREHRAS
jgi:exopolyphosphatase/guanosine-5'-triphosphate,3'-diphosphate pyrophosphatase